jgi:hypothetical protein
MTFTVRDLATLKQFTFERLLNEGNKVHPVCVRWRRLPFRLDPITHSLALLGTFPKEQGHTQRLPAILRIEKTALARESAHAYCSTLLEKVQLVDRNDCASII